MLYSRDDDKHISMTAQRQSISCYIFRAFPIDHLILKPKETRKHFLLPSYVQTLLIEMHQTVVVCMDEELSL